MIVKQIIDAIKSGKRYICLEGGARSGKTMGTISVLIKHSMKYPELTSVVSETFPHLRKGAIRDFESFFPLGLDSDPKWHKTESLYNFNAGKLEFFSVDNVSKVHGPSRNNLFMNEAQNMTWDIARHLLIRTTGFAIIDFNPTHEFWAHTELKNDPDCVWIHSTYKDNKFLKAAQIKEIERNRHNVAWWTVYGEGKIGRLEGLVYPSFQMQDELPDNGSDVWGLDFGFTNDPTAVTHCKVIGNNLYVDQVVYRSRLLTRDLAKLLEQSGCRKNYDEIFADPSQPQAIEELCSYGFNVKKADNAILPGIEFVNNYFLHVTKRSTDLIKELRNYTYVQDKEGNYTNKPIDAYNHSLDSLRYGIFTKFRNRMQENKIIVPLQRNYKNF